MAVSVCDVAVSVCVVVVSVCDVAVSLCVVVVSVCLVAVSVCLVAVSVCLVAVSTCHLFDTTHFFQCLTDVVADTCCHKREYMTVSVTCHYVDATYNCIEPIQV